MSYQKLNGLGVVDWGAILQEGIKAVPQVVQTIRPPKPAGTVEMTGGMFPTYSAAPVTTGQRVAGNLKPWLLGGGIALLGIGLVLFMLKRRRR